jgi:hypothetical protein
MMEGSKVCCKATVLPNSSVTEYWIYVSTLLIVFVVPYNKLPHESNCSHSDLTMAACLLQERVLSSFLVEMRETGLYFQTCREWRVAIQAEASFTAKPLNPECIPEDYMRGS